MSIENEKAGIQLAILRRDFPTATVTAQQPNSIWFYDENWSWVMCFDDASNVLGVFDMGRGLRTHPPDEDME